MPGILTVRRLLLPIADELRLSCPAITPTLGAELLTNGNFAAWTGDNPDSWTVAPEAAGYYVTEVAGKARLVTNGTNMYLRQTVPAVNTWFQAQLEIVTVASGAVKITNGSSVSPSYSTTGVKTFTFRGTGANSFEIVRVAACDVTFDNGLLKALTLSTCLAYLGRRTRLSGTYTCKPTLTAGTQAGLCIGYLDVNNFALFYHDGTNAKLDKCIGGTWTSVISAAAAYSAGAELKVIVNRTGFSLYYNSVQIGTTQTISDTLGTKFFGFSTLESNRVGFTTISRALS